MENGEKLIRRLDEEVNLTRSQKDSVFEIVVPTQAEDLEFELRNSTCDSARLEGYKHLDLKNITYLEVLNKSPRFEEVEDWNGKANVKNSGVIVGPGPYNQNVLTQKIPVIPFGRYKIVATASSANTLTGLGRLQINWVGLNDEFISSSGKTIEVTLDENSYEINVVAPAKALYGVLYVTPHSSEDVVRYSEMKLLKGVQL
jgi:hypothetical protein